MTKNKNHLYVTDFDTNLSKYKINDTFLGEWCFDKIDELEKKKFIKYHWLNLKKKKNDYNFLEKLRNELLSILSQKLNNFHKKKKSKRYWNILLEPWLSTYISIMFDRWESLNNATKKKKFTVNFYNKIMIENFSFYFEIPKVLASDPLYNQKIFQRLFLEKFFQKKLNLKIKDKNINFLFKRNNYPDNKYFYKIFFKSALQILDRFLTKKNNKGLIFFPFSSMSMILRIKLKFLLNFKISFFFNEIEEIENKIFKKINGNFFKSDFRKQQISKSTNNHFKNFIYKYIMTDLPTAVIEDYEFVNNLISNIKINPKIIIASANYWNKFSFKLWLAEKISNKSLFFISDHGRGLPPQKELLNFESYFCDRKLSWHRPLSKKYIQVPALLYSLYNYTNSVGKYCSVIGYENHKYGYIINFQASSTNALKSYYQVIKFYKSLNSIIKQNFLVRVRKYNDAKISWDLDRFYAKQIGQNKISKQENYIEFINNSKIIICTYPLTTFSDAIRSSRPTILILPKDCYVFHKKFQKIIDQLIKSNIIFLDPLKAANHVNNIWDNPYAWWNSSKVIKIREKYKNNFCKFDKLSTEEWCRTLKKF
jgi:putative transferase (TIGR04331 family)